MRRAGPRGGRRRRRKPSPARRGATTATATLKMGHSVQQATESRRSGRLSPMRRTSRPSRQAPALGHRLPLLTATLSPPPPATVSTMRPARDGGGHAPPVLAPWKGHQQTGGGRGGTPCATCAHAHARPAASRRPPWGRPRSSLSQEERRAQPSWRAGPQCRHHHGGPGGGGDANEHTATERGGGRRRVTGFGQCVTTQGRIWMGRAAAPSSVLLGDLALGWVVGVVGCLAAAGPQREAGHRRPALGK